MNSPSYWLKAQPDGRAEAGEGWKAGGAAIAETTLPSAPVLSAMRVISPMKRLSLLSLACWLTA
ncbi:hypothetical protein ECZU36_54820 [Escherichia coli]|nr:hypothetical protein ECZU36_54820 [Escherichia coli]